MYAVLDFEGFQMTKDCFIIKELAFQGVGESSHGYWFFLPPMHWNNLTQKQKHSFSWLTRHFHI